MDEYENNATMEEFSELEDDDETMDDADDFEVDFESAGSSDRHDDLDGDTIEDVQDEVERMCEEVLGDLEEDFREMEHEVLVKEEELEELQAQKSSLKKEVRSHRKKLRRLNSKLRKQKRTLGYIDRQQRLQDMIENYELGPNEIFMDVDELEYPDVGSISESEKRNKKREKKAKKAEARQDALEKTLRVLEDTEVAIAQADTAAGDSEADVVRMGHHTENMKKIIEDASVGRISAHQHLEAIQKSVRHFGGGHFGQSLVRPNPRVARLLYKLGKRSCAVDRLPSVAPAIPAQAAMKVLSSANAPSGPDQDPVAKDASGTCSTSVAQRFKSFIEARRQDTAYGGGRR